MGKFNQYITGITEIEISNEKFQLDVRMWDKAQIAEAQRFQGQERLLKLRDIVEKVFQRSYLKPYHFEVDERGKITRDEPYKEDEFDDKKKWQEYKKEMDGIHAFVEQKIDQIMFEFGLAWGWFTKEQSKASFREEGESKQIGKKT